MATITRRNSGWYVQVRRKGFPARNRTFETKGEGQRWAREQERRLDFCSPDPVVQPSSLAMTLGDVILRYRDLVTPRKRSADSEHLRLGKMARASICLVAVSKLSPHHGAEYRDHRLLKAKPSTVRRELSLFRVALEVARKEWGVALGRNPFDDVSRPVAHDGRERRLNPSDVRRLEAGLATFRNLYVAPLIWLLVETGLRRGEALALEWSRIDLDGRVALIPNTKNGRPRTIPLTDGAIDLLTRLPRTGALVFPISAVALRQGWQRLLARTGIVDLRLHDLRHEAISRFAEMGLNMPELALISGHRDYRMLQRYTHLRPSDLARKLAGRSWSDESARRL